jgi:hypothetical protein
MNIDSLPKVVTAIVAAQSEDMMTNNAAEHGG